jgi:hypothetical protein
MSQNPAFVIITNVPDQNYELLQQKLNLDTKLRWKGYAATLLCTSSYHTTLADYG